MNETVKNLIFVYNADSGLFNALTDIAHKMLSPKTYACHLCSITHGLLSEHDEWKQFIQDLPISVDFLHRDEFEKKYPGQAVLYPAVLQAIDENNAQVVVNSAEINRCQGLDDLKNVINGLIPA